MLHESKEKIAFLIIFLGGVAGFAWWRNKFMSAAVTPPSGQQISSPYPVMENAAPMNQTINTNTLTPYGLVFRQIYGQSYSPSPSSPALEAYFASGPGGPAMAGLLQNLGAPIN